MDKSSLSTKKEMSWKICTIMISKHEHIYYEPLVGSIRMGKNILRTREHRLNHISFYVYLAGIISCASVTQLNNNK